MDVLRAARDRLDAADYVCVKGAWLDAQRLLLLASSLHASPAETRSCADALLRALPDVHAAATPAVRAPARARALCALRRPVCSGSAGRPRCLH